MKAVYFCTSANPRPPLAVTSNFRRLPTSDAMILIKRAQNILLMPAREWPTIASEATTGQWLFLNYAVPLALIGPLANWIGMTLIGIDLPFIGVVHVTWRQALTSALTTFALILIGVSLIALIVNLLAPRFGARKNGRQALKIAIYSYTPAGLMGIVGILPMFSLITLAGGLYGFYLLYLGLPVLMRCPQDRAMAYTAATLTGILLISLVLTTLSCILRLLLSLQ